MEVKIFETISGIGREGWNSCFASELEDYDYLLAIEQSGIKNFNWFYISAVENGKVLAVCPGFTTDYDFETTMPDSLQKFSRVLKKLFPKIMIVGLAALGSPATEICNLGFNRDISEAQKIIILLEMILAFENYAARKKIKFLGFKDIAKSEIQLWQNVTDKYKQMPGLSVARLKLNFSNIDEYLSSLSSATRKDMRRKLKKMANLKIERRENIDDIISEIMLMYKETLGRANFKFEELTPEYFRGVLKQMPERSLCNIYYAENKPVAANLILFDKEKMLDKFFCMFGEVGRKYNLYFLSWFYNLEFCLEKNIKIYQSGQAAYENKLRLGSDLEPNVMYFRHKNKLVDLILRAIAPFVSFEQT